MNVIELGTHSKRRLGSYVRVYDAVTGRLKRVENSHGKPIVLANQETGRLDSIEGTDHKGLEGSPFTNKPELAIKYWGFFFGQHRELNVRLTPEQVEADCDDTTQCDSCSALLHCAKFTRGGRRYTKKNQYF